MGGRSCLFTALVDFLLDIGFISFDENYVAIFSSELENENLKAMGFDPGREFRISIINDDHRSYINYHRSYVLKP